MVGMECFSSLFSNANIEAVWNIVSNRNASYAILQILLQLQV